MNGIKGIQKRKYKIKNTPPPTNFFESFIIGSHQWWGIPQSKRIWICCEGNFLEYNHPKCNMSTFILFYSLSKIKKGNWTERNSWAINSMNFAPLGPLLMSCHRFREVFDNKLIKWAISLDNQKAIEYSCSKDREDYEQGGRLI